MDSLGRGLAGLIVSEQRAQRVAGPGARGHRGLQLRIAGRALREHLPHVGQDRV